MAASGQKLVAYVSTRGAWLHQAGDGSAGFGSDALRLIATDSAHRIDLAALRAAIAADRGAGLTPFFWSVTREPSISARSTISRRSPAAKEQGLWFHIDGALRRAGDVSPELRPRFAGIEQAEFDRFRLSQMGSDPLRRRLPFGPRRRAASRRLRLAGGLSAARGRGLAGGSPWPCDFGPDLSRGFRALKTWFTFKVYGADRIGAEIARSCALARYLEARVAAEPQLELLAPVALNIVCFRYRGADPDKAQRRDRRRTARAGDRRPLDHDRSTAGWRSGPASSTTAFSPRISTR